MAAPLGNRNRHNGTARQSAIRRALARQSGSVSAGLAQLAEKVIEAALDGEPWALNHIADRLEGRPATKVAITNADGDDPPTFHLTATDVRG